jgi:hypothetical protein
VTLTWGPKPCIDGGQDHGGRWVTMADSHAVIAVLYVKSASYARK